MDFYNKNNILILKTKFPQLFRYLFNIKNYIFKYLKILNFNYDIIYKIMNYIDNKYIYSVDFDKLIKNIPHDLQYIPYSGLQLINDDHTNEFYTNPIFCCFNCLKKYNYYCFNLNKLII